MRLVRLVVSVVCVVALAGVALAVPTAFNDVNDGEWDASVKDTWGTGVGGDYPGKEYLPGPPEVPDLDTALINSNTVTANVAIAPGVVTTVQAGGVLYIPGGATRSMTLTLDGGRLYQAGWSSASHVAGTVTVLQGSEVYTSGHSNPIAAQTSYLDADISDGATTGQLHLLGANTSILVLTGDNSGFSAGMLVDTPGYVKLDSDGALGTGAAIVNTRLVNDANQTGTVASPSSVTVNSGGRLDVGNRYNVGRTISSWPITMAGNTTLAFGPVQTGKLDATCSLTLNGDTRFYIQQDGRWNATNEIACPITSSSNILVDDSAAGEQDQGGENWTRLTLSADNSNFTGDIRVLKNGVLTNNLVDLILVGGAANALGSNNSIIVHAGAELEITDPGALNGTNIVHLLTGSEGVMDLQEDATVLALSTGGTWNDVEGEVEGGEWAGPGVYIDGFDPYVQFNGHTLTVLQTFTAVPEPAGLSLVGLALLAIRRKRS